MRELLSLTWAKNDIYGNPRMRVCVYELEQLGLSIDDLKALRCYNFRYSDHGRYVSFNVQYCYSASSFERDLLDKCKILS